MAMVGALVESGADTGVLVLGAAAERSHTQPDKRGAGGRLAKWNVKGATLAIAELIPRRGAEEQNHVVIENLVDALLGQR